jgi:hypothetical protein
MASWKKVLVSGSAGEFSTVTASIGLTVGTNQVISTTQAGTRLTGSFTGSFTGDGSGLTGVTATFPTVDAAGLISTDRIFVGTGSTSNTPSYISYGGLLTDLAGTNLAVESNDSLTLNTTISGLTSVTSTTFTANGGVDNIGFIGKITGSNVVGTVESSSYALSSSFSTTASYALNAGGGTLNISGSNGDNTSINLSTEALIVSGTANQIAVTVNNANNLLTIGLPNNVTIPGNLSVTGTTTTVSASSLLVTDKFIVLSSGSTTKNDGGIIIQSSTSPAATGSGYGFMLDGSPTAPRWGVTSSLSPTATNATTPDEYMVSAKTVGTPQTAGSTAPTYGGAAATGNGNMVIDSNGDIWIYVF